MYAAKKGAAVCENAVINTLTNGRDRTRNKEYSTGLSGRGRYPKYHQVGERKESKVTPKGDEARTPHEHHRRSARRGGCRVRNKKSVEDATAL